MNLKNKGSYKWLLVAVLWAAGCLNYMDRQSIFSNFPLLQRELSMTDSQLALLGSVFLWAYSVSSPLAGYLGDRFRRKDVILWSLVIFSLATFFTGIARTSGQLICLRGVLGVSEALYLPAALAFIADYHSRRTRSTAIGIHQTSLMAGGVLGGVFGGYMGDQYGWRKAFYILGGAGLILTVLMGPLLRETRKGASDFSSLEEMPPTANNPLAQTLGRILATPTILIIMFCGISVSMAGWAVITWMPFYLYEKFGMSLTVAGFDATFYLSISGIAAMLGGSVLADNWAKRDRRGRMFAQLLGLGLAAPAVLAVGFAKTIDKLLIILVLFGIGRGLWDCNNMPIFCDVLPPSERSTAYGVFNFANTLGGGVSVLLAGIYRNSLGLGATFSSISLMLFISLGLTLIGVSKFLMSDMRKAATESARV